jgi:hypothetical protein
MVFKLGVYGVLKVNEERLIYGQSFSLYYMGMIIFYGSVTLRDIFLLGVKLLLQVANP